MSFSWRRAPLAVLLASCAACGGGDSQPTTPTNPNNPYVITIMTGGIASPKQLQVPPGTRVLFVNDDTRRHEMASDPHPEHTDCHELNRGALNPGQSRETENLVTVRTCGFHDHENPDNVNLRGSIVIR